MRRTVRSLLRPQFLSLVVAFASLGVSFVTYAAQSPFYGSPYDIFRYSILEAELFDQGGEGLAYHDSTSINEPNGARTTESVDVELSQIASNGQDVGWVTPGEWLEYTIGVRYAASYQLSIRYASDGPGGVMHVELDGVDITGPIELIDTGGWQAWQTVSVPWIQLAETESAVLRLAFDDEGADGWLANIDYVQFQTMESTQQPYGGIRYRGGLIEAEYFDEGGEGVAYHDTTPENEPNAFRPNEGVDVEVTSDEGGGYDVGWIRPGEWLEYKIGTLDVPHTIDIRYAALGFGGTMHIEIGGHDATGPIELPDTGGWQNWKTVTVYTGDMPEPPTTMRLSFDTPGETGWSANINYVHLKPGPYPERGPLTRIPGRINAAGYDLGGEGIAYHDSTPENEGGAWRLNEGVDVEPTADSEGTYDLGWITPGEWIFYTVYVEEAGNYDIRIRHASQGGGGVMHLELMGKDKTGPIRLPDTGGWQTWETFTIRNVSLTMGRQLMRLVFDEGNAEGWLANIHYVEFLKSQ